MLYNTGHVLREISNRLLLYAIMVFCFIASTDSHAELVMQTHGAASFAPYIHGVNKNEAQYPGYRAEFLSNIDLYRHNRLVLTGIVENMTIISRSDSSVFNLDKIRYTIAPGFRYEFEKWLLKGSVHHESLYSISRAEEKKGAYWQNSIRLGLGTKGSSYLFLPEEYRSYTNTVINTWDAQINAGVFLHGSDSIWSARNHDYRYEFFSQTRYHFAAFNKWLYFITLQQHLWVEDDKSTDNKISILLNCFRKGRNGIFGVYYRYYIYDSYIENNENKLGALGVRIIF
ncbi:hypothetical protein ACFL50_03010 [Candidatus Latescibacterota bacterium]